MLTKQEFKDLDQTLFYYLYKGVKSNPPIIYGVGIRYERLRTKIRELGGITGPREHFFLETK